MERAKDVARQIEVLLLGLAKRAQAAGLTGLAGQLRNVAQEAADEAKRPAGRAVASPPAQSQEGG